MSDPRTSTSWASMPVSERVVQLARYHCDELRVEEEPRGSNRGPMVDQYLAVCGLKGQAEPWCLAFQMWLLVHAGVPEAKLPPIEIRASTQETAKWCEKHGKVVYSPLRGDIGLHLNQDGRTGHAVLYLGPGDPDEFRSIEGNTNDDGSREGYEVCRRERLNSYVTVWVRIR